MKLKREGERIMVKIILDSTLLGRLTPVESALEICDTNGRTVGYFHPALVGSSEVNPSPQSPFSDEELQRRRQQRSGRSLAGILKRLE